MNLLFEKLVKKVKRAIGRTHTSKCVVLRSRLVFALPTDIIMIDFLWLFVGTRICRYDGILKTSPLLMKQHSVAELREDAWGS